MMEVPAVLLKKEKQLTVQGSDRNEAGMYHVWVPFHHCGRLNNEKHQQ